MNPEFMFNEPGITGLGQDSYIVLHIKKQGNHFCGIHARGDKEGSYVKFESNLISKNET